MNILIAGGSGFLGTALTHALKSSGIHGKSVSITWISRFVEKEKSKNIVDKVISYDDLATTAENYDIIINLAGAGIADKRWREKRKIYLIESRMQPTEKIVDFIKNSPQKPKLLISGSAIGWYGVQNLSDVTEISENQTCTKPDFAHKLCDTWEKLALGVQDITTVAIIRTGVVIAPNGGMVGRLITPFKWGLGGRLGNGKQIMSWISVHDWVRAVLFIIDKNLNENLPKHQIYNLTHPNPITNADFTKAMGDWLHRPTFMAMPAFVVKALFGEMATLLLDGQRVVPKNLLDLGFEFKNLTVLQALRGEK